MQSQYDDQELSPSFSELSEPTESEPAKEKRAYNRKKKEAEIELITEALKAHLPELESVETNEAESPEVTELYFKTSVEKTAYFSTVTFDRKSAKPEDYNKEAEQALILQAPYVLIRSVSLEKDLEYEDICAMIDVMEANPKVAALAPVVTNASYPFLKESQYAFTETAFIQFPVILYRIEAVQKTGFIHPELVNEWGADIDLAARLRLAGYIVGVTCVASVTKKPALYTVDSKKAQDGMVAFINKAWNDLDKLCPPALQHQLPSAVKKKSLQVGRR